MSRLGELIQEFCPDGVEYKPIWSVTIWDKKFNSVDRKKQPQVINYNYLLAADLFALQQETGDVFLLSTGEQTGWTTEELAGNHMREGEVVTIPWGKSRAVADCVKYYKGKFVTADNRIMTSSDGNVLDNKYLYYVIMSMGELIDTFYRGSGIKHPDMARMLDLEIPVPPLPVQGEIVRIMDNFTRLTAELKAELDARMKQYEHYKQYLLNFKGRHDVPLMKLGDVCFVQSGGTPSKRCSEYWNGGAVKWLSSTVCKNRKSIDEVTAYITELGLKKSSAKLMRPGTTLVALVGATIGKLSFLTFEASINQNVAGIYPIDEEVILPDYIYYICSTLYEQFLNISNGKLAMANLSFVRGLEIPVPPAEEQRKIVHILERFEKLCFSADSGLPAEIAARQEQYEYYRNKLLSFKELSERGDR